VDLSRPSYYLLSLSHSAIISEFTERTCALRCAAHYRLFTTRERSVAKRFAHFGNLPYRCVQANNLRGEIPKSSAHAPRFVFRSSQLKGEQ
jgi:hypothetical protein